MGDVSDTRKKIIQNTLTQELSKHFQILPQDRFEQVQEQVFNELEYDECTEDQCIMRIQEILQIENLFHLEVIGEEGDTQLNLKWVNLDEKRNREDYCEGCKTKELRKSVIGLVEKLVGKGVVEKSVVIVEKKHAEVVEKRQKGGLFQRMVNGRWGWYEDGDEDKDGRYLGEFVPLYGENNRIEKLIPNGQGTYTFPDGKKYVGKWKDGKYNGEGIFTRPIGSKYVGEFKDGERNGQGISTSYLGFKFEGEWKKNKPWNGILYDKDGKITSKYLNGVKKVKPVVVVEKSRKGVLYQRRVDGKLGWFEDGNEKNHGKWVGEIKNGKLNGKGTYTNPDGSKYVGEFKDGNPWKGTIYDKDRNIKGKYVNGVKQ